jgi:hypothetical protein
MQLRTDETSIKKIRQKRNIPTRKPDGRHFKIGDT